MQYATDATSYSSIRKDKTLYKNKWNKSKIAKFTIGVLIAASGFAPIHTGTTRRVSAPVVSCAVPQDQPADKVPAEEKEPPAPIMIAEIAEPEEATVELPEEDVIDEVITEESIHLYDIALPETLQEHTYRLAEEYGIEQYYNVILALMWTESRFNPDAVSGTSDYGIMQINKWNHGWLQEELGITDFMDPYQNIEAGIKILSMHIHKYDDLHRALMAYNMGEGNAKKNWNKGRYSSKYSRQIINVAEELDSTNTIIE